MKNTEAANKEILEQIKHFLQPNRIVTLDGFS